MLNSLVSSQGADSKHLILCQAPLDTRMLIRVECSPDLAEYWESSRTGQQPQGHKHRAGLCPTHLDENGEESPEDTLLREKEQ